eukprot:3620704-Alexandrium_andersonii.AAC.1
MWRSHLRSHSLACVPSCARAFTALGQPLPGGRRCAPPSWRASDSSGGKQARAAFTMPSSTSGALRTGTTSPSP